MPRTMKEIALDLLKVASNAIMNFNIDNYCEGYFDHEEFSERKENLVKWREEILAEIEAAS